MYFRFFVLHLDLYPGDPKSGLVRIFARNIIKKQRFILNIDAASEIFGKMDKIHERINLGPA